jgi:hypothetical protein
LRRLPDFLLSVSPIELELELQRELHLPRRTEVAGREARVLNNAERAGSGGQHGVAEVRVVEQVEELGADLQVEPLRDSWCS